MKDDAEKCLDKIALELSEGRISAEEAEDFKNEVEEKRQQKRKILEDYQAGKIDEVDLNRWQVSISGDFGRLADEIDMAAIHKKRKADKSKKVKRRNLVIGVVAALLVAVGVIMIPTWQHEHRTIAGIPAPVQIDIEEAIVAGRVKDKNKSISGKGFRVDMTYLAEYDIKGLVVELDDYDGNGASAFDLAVPRDISMAWGKAAEYATDIRWGHAARALNYEYDWRTLEKIGVSSTELGAMASNNHIIVEEGGLRNSLKRVKIGDYIEMKGYLVSASFYDGVGQLVHKVNSSTTRYDHVEYAFDMRTSCEVIYLTDLIWLD